MVVYCHVDDPHLLEHGTLPPPSESKPTALLMLKTRGQAGRTCGVRQRAPGLPGAPVARPDVSPPPPPVLPHHYTSTPKYCPPELRAQQASPSAAGAGVATAEIPRPPPPPPPPPLLLAHCRRECRRWCAGVAGEDGGPGGRGDWRRWTRRWGCRRRWRAWTRWRACSGTTCRPCPRAPSPPCPPATPVRAPRLSLCLMGAHLPACCRAARATGGAWLALCGFVYFLIAAGCLLS